MRKNVLRLRKISALEQDKTANHFLSLALCWLGFAFVCFPIRCSRSFSSFLILSSIWSMLLSSSSSDSSALFSPNPYFLDSPRGDSMEESSSESESSESFSNYCFPSPSGFLDWGTFWPCEDSASEASDSLPILVWIYSKNDGVYNR